MSVDKNRFNLSCELKFVSLTSLLLVFCLNCIASAFDDKWRKCVANSQCTVIPTYCGGYASVLKTSQEVANLHYKEIGGMKKCSGKKISEPIPTCIQGFCEPHKIWP